MMVLYDLCDDMNVRMWVWGCQRLQFLDFQIFLFGWWIRFHLNAKLCCKSSDQTQLTMHFQRIFYVRRKLRSFQGLELFTFWISHQFLIKCPVLCVEFSIFFNSILLSSIIFFLMDFYKLEMRNYLSILQMFQIYDT